MALKRKIGVGTCPACKRELVWRKTDGGATSAFCQHCDLQLYAKDGTEAERMIQASIGAVQHETKPAAEPTPTPAPKPAPKAGLFGGLGL